MTKKLCIQLYLRTVFWDGEKQGFCVAVTDVKPLPEVGDPSKLFGRETKGTNFAKSILETRSSG